MEIVILADGQFPTHSIPLHILNTAKKIICCDDATMNLIDYGKEPDIIIGDLDSIPENIKRKYTSRLICIPGQETNDLTKAVSWCMGNHIPDITILGATGLRADHTIGNISLLIK